ncbi:hypothetical protein AMAG_16377 [Allomyces macrogynus ATCC 38327]|uniref:Mannan endo-1,4-beta-mannosidase n=1 Tax=Allomyces macrogynus (strain ATCC 38327) TaxID=578462 RepID=A0A0L0TBN6_ALLM3|nr:hypothetical protein AMAG_16377 [Allomyces macrogynus ATCC 38327]|eukprot:KNE71954.1 hypothetical protein AMAG_16377 [Allomyces macrogynus ATCC 38327]
MRAALLPLLAVASWFVAGIAPMLAAASPLVPRASGSAACTDVSPDPKYSCTQQVAWGKCNESWMAGFCNQSCGRCTSSCTDKALDTKYSCAQQVAWGKCNEAWMAGFCDKSCGRCGSGGNPTPNPAPAPSPAPAPVDMSWCTDSPPDATSTCAQQVAWGKCNEAWMAPYCHKSCGRCPSADVIKKPFAIASAPIDAQATAETKRLYSFLQSQFGHKVISGQAESANTGKNRDQEVNYVKSLTGKTPALRLFDLMFFTGPNAFDDGVLNRIVQWHQRGGIASVQLHWNTPDGHFYTKETNFDATKAATPGTWENQKVVADLAMIAGKFRMLQDKGIPILFRPLHEPDGAWFWWGAKGASAYLKLWNLVQAEFAKAGVHNVLWVHNFAGSPSSAWFPGTGKVDVVSVDRYPAARDYDPFAIDFYRLKDVTGASKLIALAENGPLPAVARMKSTGALWTYFGTWNEEFIMTEQYSTNAQKSAVFGDATVANLEDVAGKH